MAKGRRPAPPRLDDRTAAALPGVAISYWHALKLARHCPALFVPVGQQNDWLPLQHWLPQIMPAQLVPQVPVGQAHWQVVGLRTSPVGHVE